MRSSQAPEKRMPSLASRFGQLLDDLNEQWPSLKFLGFGAYYAWIWLSYNSTLLVPETNSSSLPGSAMFTIYLASTTTLAVMLILASFFASHAERLLKSRAFILCVSLAAGVGTIGSSVLSSDPTNIAFIGSSVLTGLCTAWVALKLGAIYGSAPARQTMMYTAASFVFACMLYFIAVGLPYKMGLTFMASLPILAALCAMTSRGEQNDIPKARVDEHDLPRGFFLRFVSGIAIFSIIVGVTRGCALIHESAESITSEGAIIVFGTATLATVLFLAIGLVKRTFDVSRTYYPIIILTAAGILVMPILSLISPGFADGPFESRILGIAYALFIMTIWSLCSHVSYLTKISPVRIFGLGRGASAAGTTIGWFLGAQLISSEDSATTIAVISVAMAFTLFVVVMLVFNERLIGQVLVKTLEAKKSPARRAMTLDLMPDFDESGDTGTEIHQAGFWTQCCNEIADQYGLSPREREVLFLLSKGRTLDYIGSELGISLNTTKTHSRNVYQKVGVHTRQELLDVIERKRQEAR
jgi:DNA-binding CsgD family transcriptional regulator